MAWYVERRQKGKLTGKFRVTAGFNTRGEALKKGREMQMEYPGFDWAIVQTFVMMSRLRKVKGSQKIIERPK